MNLIESLFSILTRQQVRRGAYHDAPNDRRDRHFIEQYNDRANLHLDQDRRRSARQAVRQDTSGRSTSSVRSGSFAVQRQERAGGPGSARREARWY